MKHLMSTINTTLQDSLLNSRAGSASLNSGLLTPDSMEDSMRSSTISNSSGEKPHEAHGGFEAAESDFVYETSCSTETKLFEMGKTVDTHELPLPVQELARDTQPPVPTTVESLIRES